MSNSLDPVFGQWYVGRQIGNGTDGKVFTIYKEKYDGSRETAVMKMLRLGENRNERKVFNYDDVKEESTENFDKTIKDICNNIETVRKADNGRLFIRYDDVELRKASDGKGQLILIRLEEAKSLSEVIKGFTFTLEETYRLGINICQALIKCRSFNYIYPNLKPENILFDREGRCKLGDFGSFSCLEPAKTSISYKRSQYYMAPELIRTGKINYTCDMYSLGLILYTLTNSNRLPFTEPFPENVTVNSLNESTNKRLRGEPMQKPSHASDALWKIISKACSFKPNERYFTPEHMLSDLKNALNNQPFDETKFNDVYSESNINAADDETVVIPEVQKSNIREEKEIGVMSIKEEIHIPDSYAYNTGIRTTHNKTSNAKKYEKLVDTKPKNKYDFRRLKKLMISAFVALCFVLLFIISAVMNASAAFVAEENIGYSFTAVFGPYFQYEGALLYGG